MKSKIKYAIAAFLFGLSTQLWAACVVQGDGSIIATAIGDSCTNSSAISTTANDAFGMDAGSLTSVTLSNATGATITTTGNGAAGIHSTGDDAIIINNGAITVSGIRSPVALNYADGINALGNNSQVTNNGAISVSGAGMYGVWFDNSTGGSFNNTGSIVTSGIGGVAVALGASTTTFTNSGTIVSDQDHGVGAGSVTNFTNTGEIAAAAGFYGVYAFGTIATLNNAQGGNGASGSTTALTYGGTLPTNYNIIINSPTHYGQLVGTSLVGTTTFGIYTGSALSKGSYTSVLSGFTASNLTGTTSGNYNGFTWSLSNSSGDIWDLIVNGASTADTQQSLVNTAASLQNTYTLQNTVLANSFSYDCSLFGKEGVCISAGGRNTAVQAANGLNNTSGLLIASYRLDKNNSRIGAYADQNLSVNNAGGTVTLGNNTPLVGLFGVWSERPDGIGSEVKVSAAYGQKNTTVTRGVVGDSEAGSGSSQLNSQGAQVVAKYGFDITENTIVSPYVGMRYTQNNMGGYTEGASATVTAPLTYSALNTNATTALAGVGARHSLTPKTVLFASAGVESDTNTSNGTYSATGINGLTSVNFNSNPVTTRPTASLGATYLVEKNQQLGLSGIYRQEPYQAVSTTSVFLTYTIGL